MSKWACAKCDFFDEYEKKYIIEARKPGADEEDIIAKIDPQTHEVTYIDDDAKSDPCVQEVVKEVVRRLGEVLQPKKILLPGGEPAVAPGYVELHDAKITHPRRALRFAIKKYLQHFSIDAGPDYDGRAFAERMEKALIEELKAAGVNFTDGCQIQPAVHSTAYMGGDSNIQNTMDADCTEAVEVCPYCEAENVYRNWDVEKQGYVATCHSCGKKIFLCDECLHADDNQARRCDWRGEEHDGKEYGTCFRGTTENPTDGLHEPDSFMAYEAEGTKVIFDDYEVEGASCWAELCPACLGKYKKILAGHASDGAAGTCSVKGCQNEADFYLDFKKEEISFSNEK